MGNNYGRNKYNARRIKIDGIWFDSMLEGDYYTSVVRPRLWAKEIKDIVYHKAFPLLVNGQEVCTYKCDFAFWDIKEGRFRVLDVKVGVTKTQSYRIKKKLMLAIMGIEVEEVP